MKKINGITFQIVLGKWSGAHLRRGKKVFGFCLGYLSVSIVMLDTEMLIDNLLEKNKELERKLAESILYHNNLIAETKNAENKNLLKSKKK